MPACTMPGACPIEAESALSSDAGPIGREFFVGPEELLGQFAVKFADLLRLGEEVGIGLFGEFALNPDRLVERSDRKSVV